MLILLLLLLRRYDDNGLLGLLLLLSLWLVHYDHRPLGIRDDDLRLNFDWVLRRAFVHGHALCLRSASNNNLFLLRGLGLRLDWRNNDRLSFL